MSRSASSLSGKTKHKLVFLGDQGTGKSSIIQRFINNRYEDKANPTIGIDFLAKNFIHNNRTYRLQLWDTAGQQRFKSLIPGYLKDAICGIFVYDVTSMESLHNIEKWLALYRQNKPTQAACVICANKIDLKEQKTDVEKEGLIYAQKLGLPHFNVSAKTGEHINEMFDGIIEAINSIARETRESKQIRTPGLEPIQEKDIPKNAYDFTHVQASVTNRSTAIKLNTHQLEQDRKLADQRGGCCKL